MRTLNFRVLCQEYGISAKTGYKWKERFLRDGVRGMEEELGTVQDSGVVFAWSWGGGQREHVQAGVGTSGADAKAAAAAALD